MESKLGRFYRLLSQPVDKVQDFQQQRKLRKEMSKFYDQQFREMVENGNYSKAVDLIHDEAENLDFRMAKNVTPESLAEYCLQKSEETMRTLDVEDKTDFFRKTAEKLKERYSLEKLEE